jgi:starvation-inducible DNA-binding protein
MRPTHPTQNDLPEGVRSEMAALLNAVLADATDLALQSKQAHWNVKGPHFAALHALFDQVYEEATGWVDLVAERAVQLGGVAEGTLAAVSGRTRLPAYPLDLTAGEAHVNALAGALAAFAAAVRAAVDVATEQGDAGTADLFTEVSRGADKQLWMVEAHLR